LNHESKNKTSELPNVTIIVASFENESTIEECLRSILSQDYPKHLLNVLVVDGGSNDSTAKRIEPCQVQFVSSRLNVPAAYNWASKTVKSEIVGFVDADARVEGDWLKKLVSHLNDKEVAAAGGNIATWNKHSLIPRCIGYELSHRYSRLPREVGRLATMNLLLKAKVLEEVGGFDESLPTQYDTDLGFHIVNAGYRMIFDSKALCYHYHRPTLRKFFKQQYKYGQNTWKLYLKHPQLMKGDPITDWGMNIQPLLYSVATASLVLGVIPPLTIIGLGLFLSLAAIITAYYVFLAARITYKYGDTSAMFLIVIYFVRTVAWTLGAFGSVLHSLLAKVGIRKQ
jgi:cellulose synthase/poly-beta-1,6-N-acetylglucosamine synthase-like glycosyltransferase